jgi:hypothetical protein
MGQNCISMEFRLQRVWVTVRWIIMCAYRIVVEWCWQGKSERLAYQNKTCTNATMSVTNAALNWARTQNVAVRIRRTTARPSRVIHGKPLYQFNDDQYAGRAILVVSFMTRDGIGYTTSTLWLYRTLLGNLKLMRKYFGLPTAPFSNCGSRNTGGPWRYAGGFGRKKHWKNCIWHRTNDK